MPRPLTSREFFDRAKAAHGDEYDYSQSIYRNSTSKILIKCRVHGLFGQVAGTHLRGHKCPKCSGKAVLSSEQWIDRARRVHENRYSYERCVYVGRKCRVVITCREHGDFDQIAENHSRGDGCPACSGNVRLTTEQFIRKAKEVHGDKYDYKDLAYESRSKKVKIACPDHGVFFQKPGAHLYGQGCAHCAGRGVISTADFIRHAKEVHGEKYGYEKSEYVNGSTPTCITCEMHGDFYSSPSNHIHGKTGCPDCSGKKKHTKAKWVSLARAIHGDKYDYSEVEYVNAKTKVKIKCPEHGYFLQTPNNHLVPQGCQLCAGNFCLTRIQWIEKAKARHGERYDYSEVKYRRNKGKVKIICKDHGLFEQEAGAHSRGYGCPKCFWSRDQPASIYLMKMDSFVKVGVSIKPESRLAQLNRRGKHKAKLLKTWQMPSFPQAQQAEFAAHLALASYSAGLTGFDGATEWFKVAPAQAASVIQQIVSQDPRQLSLSFATARSQ